VAGHLSEEERLGGMKPFPQHFGVALSAQLDSHK
jgi:hypothetical protein